jgi:hypothetical protein
MEPITTLADALLVIAKTPAIREWLSANDPKALEQVEIALATYRSNYRDLQRKLTK